MGDAMDVRLGVALIAGGSGLGLVVVFALWRRIRGWMALGLLVLCGLAIAAGGLLVQDEVDTGSWVVALALLGALSPVHGRLVFGRPGRGR
jgi:hypothetical protein